jgi:hypothetical protein
MTLYHFHVRDALGLVEDEAGFDLPDLPSVHREALRSAREFCLDGPVLEPMAFEITDDTGRVVLQVPIQDLHKKTLAGSALAAEQPRGAE